MNDKITIKCESQELYEAVLKRLSDCWYHDTPSFYQYYLENILHLLNLA